MADDPQLKSGVPDLWPQVMALHDVGRGVRRAMVADEATRARIAKALNLVRLDALEAELEVRPWLDGFEIAGDWSASVTQVCGVTLEPFATALDGTLLVRAVRPDSPLAQTGDEPLDLSADDPPDVLEGDQLNLGAYLLEELSLSIDPFPRKPDVTFEAPEPTAEISPFAALLKLKADRSDG